MGDVVKIAAKTALILVVSAAILALFANIQLPAIDTSSLTQGLSTALAIAFHWCPVLRVLWPVCLSILALKLSILVFHIGAIAWRWIFKINE